MISVKMGFMLATISWYEGEALYIRFENCVAFGGK